MKGHLERSSSLKREQKTKERDRMREEELLRQREEEVLRQNRSRERRRSRSESRSPSPPPPRPRSPRRSPPLVHRRDQRNQRSPSLDSSSLSRSRYNVRGNGDDDSEEEYVKRPRRPEERRPVSAFTLMPLISGQVTHVSHSS